MIRRHFLSAAVAVGLIVLAPTPGQTTTPEGASQHVEKLAQQAITILSKGEMSLADREAAFREILEDGFATELIARFVLGKYWRKASEGERVEFTELFIDYVLKTFSNRLGGYQGEQFSVTGTRNAGKKDVMVNTRIDRPSGEPIQAAWRVREIKGRYLILDVMVQGVSMAITQRDEFASVIQREGVGGLIQLLRAKTQRLSVAGS